MKNQTLNSMIIAGISTSHKIKNFDNTAEEIGKLWQQFFSEDIKSKITDKVNNKWYCIYHSYDGNYKNPYHVTIGYQVNDTSNLADGISSIEIPAQNYQVFEAAGEMPKSIIDTWMHIWDQENNINRAYNFDFECYDPEKLEKNIVEIYIAMK